MKQLELKQYMFTFEEGGWNTVWAKTLRGAKTVCSTIQRLSNLKPTSGFCSFENRTRFEKCNEFVLLKFKI